MSNEAMEAFDRIKALAIALKEDNFASDADGRQWAQDIIDEVSALEQSQESQAPSSATHSEAVDVEGELNWIKGRMQSCRDKMNIAIEEMIDLETKLISRAPQDNTTSMEDFTKELYEEGHGPAIEKGREELDEYVKSKQDTELEEAVRDAKNAFEKALSKTLDDICECIGATKEYNQAKSGIRNRFEVVFDEWLEKHAAIITKVGGE